LTRWLKLSHSLTRTDTVCADGDGREWRELKNVGVAPIEGLRSHDVKYSFGGERFLSDW